MEEPNGFKSDGIVSASTNARIIIRDIVGKYSWDTNALYKLSTEDIVDGGGKLNLFWIYVLLRGNKMD